MLLFVFLVAGTGKDFGTMYQYEVAARSGNDLSLQQKSNGYTNDDETKVYDMSEAEEPNLINGFLEDKEVQRLRTEAGVNLVSHETLSSVSKYKIW